MPLYDDPYRGRTISSVDQEGRVLHAYDIGRKIDEGGMGVVYEAMRNDGTRVAVKFIGRDLAATNVKAVERFARETQAMVRIDHPNVVKILDFGTDSGRMFLVMEYIDGRSLQGILDATRGKPLKWEYARNFLLQICNGLQAAHEKDVWHRDIKPSNVLITHNDHLKLIDFGAAKLDDSRYITITTTGRAIGTYFYMAPEVLQGFNYNHRVDIYSLGVLIYQFLSGELPFNGTCEAAVVARILDTSRETREDRLHTRLLELGIPSAIGDVALKALHYDPDARYQTIREVYDAIAECEWDGSHVFEHEKTQIQHRPARMPFWLKAGTALALIGAASFAAYNFRSQLAEAYNERAVPALREHNIEAPRIRLPAASYAAYIDSRPRGAHVYEVRADGTPAPAPLGTTPISREFTGTHTFLVKNEDQSARVVISPESRRAIANLSRKKPSPSPAPAPVAPQPAEVETVYVDE